MSLAPHCVPRGNMAPARLQSVDRVQSNLTGYPILDACLQGDLSLVQDLVRDSRGHLTFTDDRGYNVAHVAAQGEIRKPPALTHVELFCMDVVSSP